MSLDKILQKINKEAEAEVAKILKEAEAGVSKLDQIKSAKLDGLKNAARKEEELADIEIKNAILLPAKLKLRGAYLSAKLNLIDKIFQESMEFEDDEYKKVLKYLFSEVKDVSGGTLYPATGKEKITMEFVKENDIEVKLGDSIDGINGGFLLKKERVEYDCSFTTLLKKLKEGLEAKVAGLFAV